MLLPETSPRDRQTAPRIGTKATGIGAGLRCFCKNTKKKLSLVSGSLRPLHLSEGFTEPHAIRFCSRLIFSSFKIKTLKTMEFRFTIALIYDFDGTLAPGNMQEYDFIPAVGKSNKEFWTEANTLAEEQDADMVLTYMARMIQEAKSKA